MIALCHLNIEKICVLIACQSISSWVFRYIVRHEPLCSKSMHDYVYLMCHVILNCYTHRRNRIIYPPANRAERLIKILTKYGDPK
jgi:hypothetical protein